MANFSDQNLTCRDCSKPFVWTAGEQEFYQAKGFANPPSRCSDCRKIKSSSPRQMFDITCGKCGKPAQVPFQPKGDRPVFCNNCFRTQRE